jgi:protease-4
MIDEFYATFVTRVSNGRKLPYETIDKIAEGRVWSGNNAHERGLVDVMGGLTAAIEIAAQKANLDNYRIVELPKFEDPLKQIMKELTGDATERLVRRELDKNYKYYKYIKQLLDGDRIQTRLPFDISVH